MPSPSAIQNLDVANYFVGDRVGALRRPNIDDLAPGTGGVVDLDGKTVAAFRSEAGSLKIVSATYQHAAIARRPHSNEWFGDPRVQRQTEDR